MEFQCYFGVFMTAKLTSYKAVNYTTYWTSQKRLKRQKRMAGLNRGLLTLLTVITDKKNVPSAL